MEILILSSTILVSITGKKIHKLKFMNDLIKNNYKLENYNYDKSILYLIPIINMFYLIRNIKIFDIKNIDNLQNNSIIIPLTKKEKNMYEDYPSIATVLNINLFKNNKSNMIIMDLEKGNENTMYITSEDDNYIINEVKGPISNLSKEEQYMFLEQELESIDYSKPKIKIKR